MRLDRFLSEMGVETRSRIREMCRKGRIKVNGTVQKKSDLQVSPEDDIVEVDGERILFAAKEYYMLNKPAGVVTATVDTREKTVLDLLTVRKRKDLFPVGRLDKDTEGLLLITNDGELSARLLSPKHHVPKKYYAEVRGELQPDAAEQFLKGLDIGDEKETLPAELVILTSEEPKEVEITLTEGRYHQVKRMIEAVGGEVVYLKRLSMGSLTLDPSLSPGEYRKLTEEEVEMLRV